MASIRRTMSSVRREGSEQGDEAATDSSPSPKFSHPQKYFAFGRSKPKVPSWRRSFLQFSVCFMIGMFIGFTPFLMLEMSHKSASTHQAFSSTVDSTDVDMLPLDDTRKPMLETSILAANLSINESVVELQSHEDPDTGVSVSLRPDMDFVSRKQLIVVTPIYTSPLQAYSLNRLAHTLRNVPPPLLWIVVEMTYQSPETSEILRKSGVMYRHLVCQENITEDANRLIHQRNVALFHVEKHHLDGILYFADNDIIYSFDLFDEMRDIRRFGIWPVATFSQDKRYTILEGPVCNGSHVVGWHTSRKHSLSRRRFHASLAGFAFNSSILWDSKTWRRPTRDLIRQLDNVKVDFQVSAFIEQLVEDESQMEGLPEGCSKIMAWHLYSEPPDVPHPTGWTLQSNMEPTIPAHLEMAGRCDFQSCTAPFFLRLSKLATCIPNCLLFLCRIHIDYFCSWEAFMLRTHRLDRRLHG